VTFTEKLIVSAKGRVKQLKEKNEVFIESAKKQQMEL
jgi:hypothetical protein